MVNGTVTTIGRHGGLMVSAHNSGASASGLSPGRGLASHPGGVEILQVISDATETGISSGLMSHLSRMQTFYWHHH